jgi:recombination protein RecT
MSQNAINNTKAALQKQGNGTQSLEQQKYRRVDDALQKMKSAIAQALPKHITPDRISRIALTSIRMNPKLLECSELSLLGAVLQSAQLGLEPNVMGQCYLIPYKNKGVMEVQFQIGYLGLINLFYRSSEAQTLQAQVVYENDVFEYEFGLDPKIIHKPRTKGSRGEAIAYYAIAKLKNGGFGFEVMSVDDVKAHATKYSQSYKNGYSSPWKTDFDAMALKTVIKRALKYMPKSIEIERALAADESIREYADDAFDIESMVDKTDHAVIDVPSDPEQGSVESEFNPGPFAKEWATAQATGDAALIAAVKSAIQSGDEQAVFDALK